MHQILFTVPFVDFPFASFGAMMFVAFAVVALWGAVRCRAVGLPPPQTQDLALVLLGSGIAGARLVYMLQYPEHFPDRSALGLFLAFFKLWNGGIVFYGSIFTGVLGYLIFRRVVMKRFGVNGWHLADAVAPLMAFGMAVGRIGCYLNGCCWGQPAFDDLQTVPLSAALGEFPILSAGECQKQVCNPARGDARLPQIHGLQTLAGFSVKPVDDLGPDPRAVVQALEPGSAAAAAGLRPGDRIAKVNGAPNRIAYTLSGRQSAVDEAVKRLAAAGGTRVDAAVPTFAFDDAAKAKAARVKLADLAGELTVGGQDQAGEMLKYAWPRGRNDVVLTVERDGGTVDVAFTPRTVGFFPTQLYETVSMLLLTGLLLAFQPFRRHDGQVMVLLILGYAAHRFLNEAIRIEPAYALGLTLSQWIAVGTAAFAVLMELYLRWSQPKLPPGAVPLGWRPAA